MIDILNIRFRRNNKQTYLLITNKLPYKISIVLNKLSDMGMSQYMEEH